MTLSYHTPGPRVRGVARRLWWAVLIVALVYLAGLVLLYEPAAMWWLDRWVGIEGTPAAPLLIGGPEGVVLPFRVFNRPRLDYALYASGYLAMLLVMQWLFLAPRGAWRVRLSTEGRSMKRAAVAAAFIAMLISIGLVGTLMEWPWTVPMERTLWGRLVSMPRGVEEPGPCWPVWLAMLILWAAWSWVFWIYSRRRDRHTAMARILRALFAGTLLEMLVAVPVYVTTAREDECYCARGSYTGVVFGCTAMLWLFGPGLFLLFLREKRRRELLGAGET